MENLNGIKLQRQDLRIEKGQYIFFKQLENKTDKKNLLNDSIFEKYDSLLISPEDELFGLTKENEKNFIIYIPDSYMEAQQLFISD